MTNRISRVITVVVLIFLFPLLPGTVTTVTASGRDRWTRAELDEIRSLSLAALEPLPRDPTNQVADDPVAADLGRRLFHDTRLSSNGRVACSTCHQPERGLQDGIALGIGVGTASRRTMPLAGMARAPFLFWDGRKDSLWAQALGPLENPVEHGGTRAQYAHVVADAYGPEYAQIFGAQPDLSGVPAAAGPVADQAASALWSALSQAQRDRVTRVFVNIGKAIAAYERQIEFGWSRFDRYVASSAAGQSEPGILTDDEVAGLRLFIGKGQCTQCHNGPLFTSHEFHNTAVPPRPGLTLDHGRLTGATAVLSDEFNCRSQWSDARDRCPELEFMVTGDHTLDRAYKVPSLRNVAERAPYMDAGQFATLAEVLDHYNRAPAAATGHSDLRPLGLKPRELRQLEAFLRSLSSPLRVGGLAAGKTE